MTLDIEEIASLLLIAAIVAMIARRFRLPYTVGLVATGVALAYSPAVPRIHLTKELVFTALLPPLIFEAAFHIRWSDLRRNLGVILLLATVGVVISAGITAFGMRAIAGWDWTAAVLFGVLIAATDPVSVIATFKEAGVQGRLRLLVEAESLFNDGTAAVAFSMALLLIGGSTLSVTQVAGTFLSTVLGGILCGGAIGGLVLLLAGATEDHLIEITFTTVAAYGSFLIAERLHFSGVLATLTAGIVLGNIGSLGALTDRGREAVVSFWDYVAFVSNSLIFLLLGVREAQLNLSAAAGPILIAIGLVLSGRAVAVYGCLIVFRKSEMRVPAANQHILVWGGLRGALALALSLGLPANTPRREEIITVAFGVVAFSVIVQGLTITPLLRRLGQITPPSEPTVRASGNPDT